MRQALPDCRLAGAQSAQFDGLHTSRHQTQSRPARHAQFSLRRRLLQSLRVYLFMKEKVRGPIWAVSGMTEVLLEVRLFGPGARKTNRDSGVPHFGRAVELGWPPFGAARAEGLAHGGEKRLWGFDELAAKVPDVESLVPG